MLRRNHEILRKVDLKAAPDKTFFFLRTVKFLGHIVENNTLRPIHSKIESIKKLKTPESKKDLMRFVGAINFYSKYIHNLQPHLKPFHELLHNDKLFQWNDALEIKFKEVKEMISSKSIVVIPNTKKNIFYNCRRIRT